MLPTLRTEIRNVALRFCVEGVYRDAMLRALRRPSFALHPEAACRAGTLTLHVYRAICGTLSDIAFQAAAGVELQMEAAFMFDDIADDDVDPNNGLSTAEELALAIAMLSCGSAAASEASHRAVRNGLIEAPLVDFHSSYINACGGQFLDAHFERREFASPEEALEMTTQKSGSLGKFSAEFGAGIATNDRTVVNLFGEFGFNLFTYLQLLDDLRDACPVEDMPRDLMQHKKTVPLVFFYNSQPETRPVANDGIISPLNWKEAAHSVRQEYEDCGAELFCAIVAETFLNRAKDNLADLKKILGAVDTFEHLVSSLEISSQESVAS